ncbi:MAG: type 4a pilus biogenesis protein PilO [Bacteriovoracia bacterium]
MKELVNKLIANIHILILLYGLYGTWVVFDEHSVQVEEIKTRETLMNQDIATAQQKVKEIQDFLKKTDEYKTRVEEVAKNIETVQKQLPAETNDSQILSFFQKEINALNIKDANIAPGAEDKSVYYISKDYNLQGTGTFLQFLIFFERIATADRIYNIKNLKLTVTDDGQKGRYQVINGEGVIQAFRFNPEFKVDRGF